MQFHIGALTYTLIVANRRIYDENGDELEGRAIASPRAIIISSAVLPERRLEVLRHEVQHCWHFHIPRPSCEEEECNLAAFIDRQFHDDLDAQGGREALEQMPMDECPEFGRPKGTVKQPGREVLGQSDRVECGSCGASVMCGSINNGPAGLHEPTKQYRLERWMSCDACGSVQVWTEVCAPDGTPLGEFVSNPSPRRLRGREAARWIAERQAMLQSA